MADHRKKLGEILVDAGIINTMQLSVALGEQKQWGGMLGSVVVKLGFADEKAIAEVLEREFGQLCMSLENREISPDVLKKVSIDIAKKYGVIPLDFDRGGLTLAVSDPTDLAIIDELSFVLGVKVKPVLALESCIMRAIAFHYEGVTTEGKPPRTILSTSPEGVSLIRDERDRTPQASVEKPGQLPTEKKEVTMKAIVEALAALLVEKGVITKAELMQKIRDKGV